MAQEVKNIDDVLSCLMSMGFEFEDCQAAICCGKITVQSAVEWLIAGKPGLETVNPEKTQCKLYRDKGSNSGTNSFGSSNPFVSPIPIPAAQTVSDGQRSATASEHQSPAEEFADQEAGVTSRLYVNEKQRKMKEQFEEKQRDEAKRVAAREKQQQKTARAQVLRQIAEDRENRISVKPMKQEPIPPKEAEDLHQETRLDEPQSPQSSRTSTIQVRLPNGEVLRHSFPEDAELRTVWDHVETWYQQTDGMCLMQPFPRKEYSHSEMALTLKALGLVPSGSLVLKKEDPSQAVGSLGALVTQVEQSPTGNSATFGREENQSPSSTNLKMRETPQMPVLHDVLTTSLSDHQRHRWGHGQRLVEDIHEQHNDGEQMQDDDERLRMIEDIVMGQQLPPDLLANPALHHERRSAFWGSGQRLVHAGDPRAEGLHHNRRPRELAAEAASHRSVVSPSTSRHQDDDDLHSHLFFQVPSLEQVCFQNISARLVDPRDHLVSLSGLSEKVAQRIVEYLRQENLLKPRTLQPFVPCRLQRLILDSYSYATNELLHSARLHTNLVHLSLGSCSLITDGGLQAISGLWRLKILNLSSCRQLTNKCLRVIAGLQSLSVLLLEDTGVTDEGVLEYAATKPCHLSCLNLSQTAVTQKIFTALQDLPRLKALFLELSQVSSLSGVECLVQLTTLDISHTTIVTESLSCLSCHPSLTSLSIANTANVIGDQALPYIAGLKLSELKLPSRLNTTDVGMSSLAGLRLITLDLTNYIKIGDPGMLHIGAISSLQTLLLSNTRVTDKGMHHLQGLKRLEVLYVDRTQITDSCAPVFQSFKRLQELSLASTSISSHFLCIQSLNACTHLERLNLSRTRITNKGLHHLQLPKLTLLNLDGTRVQTTAGHRLTGCPHLERVTLNNLVPVTSDDEDDANDNIGNADIA